jgi:hypothetical protein
MLREVVEVTAVGDYRLHLKFDDGVEGDVDIAKVVPFKGVFAPLANDSEFWRVSVHNELGVIYWPNGADLDSDVLYGLVTGKSMPVSTVE